MDKITLTYHTNYNGWSIDEDTHPELADTDLEDNLCDMSVDFCDEDGEFEYGVFNEACISSITKFVHDSLGTSDVVITIEYDRFST